MNSKEFINYLKEKYKCKETLEKHDVVSSDYAKILEGIVAIEKDLDVLELLKTQVVKTEQGWYIDTDGSCFDYDSKENKLIKEWLENDK